MEDLVMAVNIAQEAALESNSGNSQKAIELYKRAIGILHESYKNETDENMKRKIFNQMKSYLEKAEAIKGITTTPKPQVVTYTTREDSPIEVNETISQCVKWSDVAGLEVAKEVLEEAILMPMRFPNIFTSKIRPWKSILLYGPPGTGKTLIAKACASECNIPFIAISSADIMSKWQGESEKYVKNLFTNAPSRCIIFIDEIDSICGERNETDSESSKRVKTELLIQMQDLFNSEKHAIVIAATNLPWSLDSAVRRRFEKRIYIPLPDKVTRRQIIEMNLSGISNNISDSDLDCISDSTNGFNASDLGILIRTAVMESLKSCKESTHFKLLPNGNYTPCGKDELNAISISFNNIPPNKLSPPIIDKNIIKSSLSVVKSSVDPKTLDRYEQWSRQFGIN